MAGGDRPLPIYSWLLSCRGKLVWKAVFKKRQQEGCSLWCTSLWGRWLSKARMHAHTAHVYTHTHTCTRWACIRSCTEVGIPVTQSRLFRLTPQTGRRRPVQPQCTGPSVTGFKASRAWQGRAGQHQRSPLQLQTSR